ncbi:MAG: DUF3488 and transglutaminase-like domain-containing protein [Porticoccaceae bacterium]
MTAHWQLNRAGLFWLVVAFCVITAMHFDHLPPWINAAGVVVVVWRIQLYRGAWSPPGRLMRFLLMALCVMGLLVEYGKPTGLEPMVALLASTFALKLLEMNSKRDSYLVVFMAFFLSLLLALFDQSIRSALFMAICLLLSTAALIGLHGQGVEYRLWRPLRSASILLLQAVPLMVLMFLVMPRIGALWSVPQNNHSAKTGMSETVSPGDFSKLARSAKLAFRVSFEGEVPPRHQLYWRGLILSNFDGRQWSGAGAQGYGRESLLWWHGEPVPDWNKLVERRSNRVEYEVIIEPTQQAWLFALSTPQPKSRDVALTRDFRLIARRPLAAKTRYRVQSWLDYRLSPDSLTRWRRAVELNIPEGFNPQTVVLARQWRSENLDEHTLIRRVLGLYNEQFVYTLEPPPLGKHSVDEFLFASKRGFCEHFASSFVFFMRAASVPARVVVGYQGGEVHPDGYLLVRQYDAHAWAEVWIEGEGWIRVDPTAAVAPERIEGSLADILGEEQEFLADSPLSLVRFRHINWLNNVRLRLESMNYAWARWVLGYDKEQDNILKNWFGDTSPVRIALWLLCVGGAIIGALSWLYLRQSVASRHDELDQLFLRVCRQLEKAGYPRKTGEGPQAYAERVAASRPDIARQVTAINRRYQRMRYGGEPHQTDGTQARGKAI